MYNSYLHIYIPELVGKCTVIACDIDMRGFAITLEKIKMKGSYVYFNI